MTSTPPRLVRTDRTPRAMNRAARIGRLVQQVLGADDRLGVALSDRPDPLASGSPLAVDLPWGVWPERAPAPDAQPTAAPPSYAELLRAKATRDRPFPRRGLPMVTRRHGGTRHGADHGPSGLARSLRPVDLAPPPVGDPSGALSPAGGGA